MPVNFYLLVLFTLVSGCGLLDKKDSNDNASANSCAQKKSEIEGSIAKLNYCESVSDCAYTGINPRWGCYIYYNKSENAKTVQDSIDSYSASSCWDGTTTLTMLACLPVSEKYLGCVDKKCDFVP
jgi:hypothetical protein